MTKPADRLRRSVDSGWSADAVCADGELAIDAAALLDEAERVFGDLLTFDRVERPAFRSKPEGAPNSTVRIAQDKLIALEDAALALLAKLRGEA